MSSSRDDYHPEAIGEKVLATAVASARDTWGDRLVAAYALGSLAHGGFSIHVSDVDLGLILSDPLEDQDTAEMANLSGEAPGGRFPPLDRLDLIQYGRLLAGRDVREQLPSPSLKDLVVVGAEFALRLLSKPDDVAKLKDSEALAAGDLIKLTKTVLFPVRFFFTAGAGKVGMNDLAVEYFAATITGPAAELALRTLKWREAPPEPGDPATRKVLEDGLIPLYRVFIDDYEPRLRDYGRADLAEDFRGWREQLLAP